MMSNQKFTLLFRGYRRSGNHYLKNLINLNFSKIEIYKNIHRLPKPEDYNPLYKHIFIYRNFKDVSKSLFNLKNKFCINTNSFEEFISKPGKDLFDLKIPTNDETIFVRRDNTMSIINTPSTFLKNMKTTIKEDYNIYNKAWFDFAKEKNNKIKNSIIIIKYENLIGDFENTMNQISMFLINSTLKEYKNINFKVGVFQKDDKIIHKK